MKSALVATSLATVAALTAPAGADTSLAEKFAADRLAAFARGDVATLVAQYAEDATVVTPTGMLQGRDQIRGMIEAIVAEFAQPDVKFELLSQQVVGPIVTFTWTAQTGAQTYDLGAETYVVEDGLATYQTFAAKTTPR